ncbi:MULTISPECIES: TrkA family potassium uptake protein [unclassified Lactococcus]|uniref:potassium channel family protein n=1 Tax=unclassified Lactococcus TaxID=2643510 RepID=UPI0011C7E82D|nr:MULTISPECIES: TrkA family potassium uptake protein [unclassified Lactococcus]MQW22922.1 TrkA family potassium uptake protein [Lactococcus sp. dk101]TXK44531.1 TrkA family potassium uptake protein [Lactococcus sp. dk310]TXK50384.1 TrkA family potassium uptake protein [Lactococcus sp. dk322]
MKNKINWTSKSVLVIGLGKFGRYLALKMQEFGNEIMVVDKEEKEAQKVSNLIDDIFIGDCTNEAVLKSLGVTDFDICFVTIGEDFEASITITMLLKKLGAQYIVVKTGSELQSELLRKIGADEIIYPERELAEKLALKYHSNHMFESYLELSSEYSIVEMEVPEHWIGKSMQKLDIRKKHGLNVIAIKNDDEIKVVPDANYLFHANDVLVVIGKQADIGNSAKHMY